MKVEDQNGSVGTVANISFGRPRNLGVHFPAGKNFILFSKVSRITYSAIQ
jgi:hypothetical protein